MDFAVDITNVVLETERLLLRAWRIGDLVDFYEYASVAGVGEAAGWNRHKSIGESRKILESFIEGKEIFAVVYKQNGKAIGSLGLHRSWACDDAAFAHFTSKEIGYVLSKDYWGRGLMVEAVRAVIKYCFDVCRIDALTCGHFLTNDRSRRVIEKCGFKFVKQDFFHAKQLQKTFEDKKYILLRQN